jgi:nitrogen regulatory protein PII
MILHPKKLITIVCESIAREKLVAIIKECGAKGYTVNQVEGWGAKGSRFAGIPEDSNIELKTIVGPLRAERILERLSAEIMPRFATVAFVADVGVLRSEKF